MFKSGNNLNQGTISMENISRLDIKSPQLEKVLAKAYHYLRYYQITKDYCKNYYHTYFNLCLEYREKENEMVEHYYLQFIINDIIATGEYTLEGIAHQAHIPLDTLADIVTGLNIAPSYQTVFRLLELHSSL